MPHNECGATTRGFRMLISRRNFMVTSIGATTATTLGTDFLFGGDQTPALHRAAIGLHNERTIRQPTFSITPVVADGRWIWKDPPEGETGYLEPRQFEVSIGIRWTGRGDATNLVASTVAPTEHPEQKVETSGVVPKGCAAKVNKLADGAAQLVAGAAGIVKGQVIEAIANFKLTISKDYRGFEKEQFLEDQPINNLLRKAYLGNSPGIQTTSRHVKQVVSETLGDQSHPWDKAMKFYQWVWENIKGKPGVYTSVSEAIRKKVGDCEERAGVFVALCRSADIPARLVWVPNHCWAEIGLFDEQNKFHWIPIHTAAYSWFGWTGAHELVLQKGDSIPVYGKKRPERLVSDWHQWKGTQPKIEFLASIKPVESEGEPAGPGAREKQSTGQWKITGTHPANQYLRNT